MLRTRLLTAVAATAMLVAPAAFAQTPDQTQAPTTPPAMTAPEATPQSQPAPAPAAPAATPAPAAAAAPQAAPAPAAQANSVIDVLRAQGNFTTLLSALEQAQLTETLASRPAITVLAPTDAAFAALPEAERTRLLDPANAQELRNLLLYHVIVADVSEDQIKGAAGPVETAGGTKIQIDGSGDQIKADGAIVSAEVDAGNGGIFPIDKVLNPTQSQAAMGDEDAADAAAPDAATTTPAAPAASTTAPATPSTTAPTPGTTTTAPAQPGTTAPNGQPAATTSTTASPTVPNPTDGQVDDEDADAGRTTPPTQKPDAEDGEEDGTEPARPQS